MDNRQIILHHTWFLLIHLYSLRLKNKTYYFIIYVLISFYVSPISPSRLSSSTSNKIERKKGVNCFS